MCNTWLRVLSYYLFNNKAMDNSLKTIKGRITRIFNGYPKADGLYGFGLEVDPQYANLVEYNQYGNITCFGRTTLDLDTGDQVELTEVSKSKSKTYQGTYNFGHLDMVLDERPQLIKFLQNFHGIGPVAATRIVNGFGMDAREYIKQNPELVKNTCRLTDKQIQALHGGLIANDEKAVLSQFLYELSSKMIDNILEHFIGKNKDYQTVKGLMKAIEDNPYILCKVPRISFLKADPVALRLGIDRYSELRLSEALLYYMKQNGVKNLYINLSNKYEYTRLINDMNKLLGITFNSGAECSHFYASFIKSCHSPDPEDDAYFTLDYYKNPQTGNSEAHLYLKDIFIAQQHCLHFLQNKAVISNRNPQPFDFEDFKYTIQDYQDAKNLTLTDEQIKAAQNALASEVSIITGGPGRGKTCMIDFIASTWENYSSFNRVILLAPTGKAMNKLKTVTHNDYNTMTVDRFICQLKFADQGSRSDVDDRHTFIIIDESSMIDICKASELFKIAPLCRFCFVGDADQLPPISPGDFFKDLIESDKFPVSRLTTPLRNHGLILQNAEKINAKNTQLEFDNKEMSFIKTTGDSQEVTEQIIDKYLQEVAEIGDPSSVALLCPVKSGETGVADLNIIAQDRLCPKSGSGVPVKIHPFGESAIVEKGFELDSWYGCKGKATKFRIGDLVMNTENDYEAQLYSQKDPVDEYVYKKAEDQGIFNGEWGFITSYIPTFQNPENDQTISLVGIKMYNNMTVFVPLQELSERFDLGYAITVHKAQGSEYKSVIYVSPHRMAAWANTSSDIGGFVTKNLIYTGVTRAQEKVLIVGSEKSVAACIMHDYPKYNSTFLSRLQNDVEKTIPIEEKYDFEELNYRDDL